MPLHAHQKRVPRIFDSLHDSVQIAADNDQIKANSVDCLIVQAIDTAAVSAQQGADEAFRLHLQGLEWQHCPAVGGHLAMRFQLLEQVAAAPGVEQLRAATNAEQGRCLASASSITADSRASRAASYLGTTSGSAA